MDHCYWVTEKLVGRCGPLKHQWDLDELYRKGIRVIISLDDKIDAETITEKGFTHIPLYVPDLALTTSSLKQIFLEAAETFVDLVTSEEEPILVHCYAGNDRTGAMLACFLISQGMPADKAIAEVRRLNPTALVTSGYEDVVRQYAAMHTGFT
ncbi:MAG: dual specificity protein phosphatase family protein [Theionarchaea archaeon]|nr:dual specificity protein phosphatase family protein [Theionarchaea archaeon]